MVIATKAIKYPSIDNVYDTWSTMKGKQLNNIHIEIFFYINDVP